MTVTHPNATTARLRDVVAKCTHVDASGKRCGKLFTPRNHYQTECNSHPRRLTTDDERLLLFQTLLENERFRRMEFRAHDLSRHSNVDLFKVRAFLSQLHNDRLIEPGTQWTKHRHYRVVDWNLLELSKSVHHLTLLRERSNDARLGP